MNLSLTAEQFSHLFLGTFRRFSPYFTSVREVVKDQLLKMSICDQASPDHLGTLAKNISG